MNAMASVPRKLRRKLKRLVTAPRRLLALRGDNAELRTTAAAQSERIERLQARVTKQAAEIKRLRALVKDLRVGQLHHLLPDHIAAVAEAVKREHLTLLPVRALAGLAQALIEVEMAGVPGLVIEAGTARGGSAIVLATVKSPHRPMKVYDVFGMIPPPSDKDGEDVHNRYATIKAGKARGGEEYYGYRDNLYDEVTESFTRHGVPVADNHVELVRGLFSDTIHLAEPVAFAHIDGDWYESTMTCLQRIVPHLSVGGRLVIDDYFTWSGCRTAVDEFFAGRDEFELSPGVRLHVTRRAESAVA